MNMFARFDKNPALTLQDIKKTKRYRRTDACTLRTDARTDGQRENSIPTTNKVCGGIKMQMTAIHFGSERVKLYEVTTLYRKSIKLFHQKLW